ncbi:hypothetical protein [Streptomyces violascens]|uniref:hypothetical protein n=1 Tax=Streptomyces violascens TaxID=67381 RepID=UPI003664F5F0
MIALSPGRKLPPGRDPLRMLLSSTPWRAAGYLAGYLVAGPVLFAVAALCLALLLYASCLVVAAARLHLTVAHTLLRPPPDPLARAKRVLTEPGPLALVSHGPLPGLTLSEGHSS